MSRLRAAAEAADSGRVRLALADMLDRADFADLLIAELASWRDGPLRDFVMAHVSVEAGPDPDQVTITLVDPPS